MTFTLSLAQLVDMGHLAEGQRLYVWFYELKETRYEVKVCNGEFHYEDIHHRAPRRLIRHLIKRVDPDKLRHTHGREWNSIYTMEGQPLSSIRWMVADAQFKACAVHNFVGTRDKHGGYFEVTRPDVTMETLVATLTCLTIDPAKSRVKYIPPDKIKRCLQ